MSRKLGAFDPASTATTVTGDIDTSFTSLYMPGDTSIADESGTQTLTTGGSPTISSLNQFGGGSIHFDSSADTIQFNNASDSLNFSSAFSIEFWAYPTGNSTDVILYFSNPGNYYHGLGIYARSSTWTYRTSTGGSNFQTGDITFGPCTQNQWQHVSLCRTSDNKIRGFVDGVFGTAVDIAGTFRNDGVYGISRNSPSSQRYLGYIDDLVILKNHALRTTSDNFDVPTIANGGGINNQVSDTRTHSHVWNYPDIYKARRADTWPTVPAVTRTIQIHVAGGGGGGGGQAVGGDGGDGGVVSVQKTGVAVGTILTYVVGGGGKGGFYGAGRSSGQVIGITSGPMAGGGALVASDGDFSSSVNQSGAEGGAGSGVFLTTATQANAIVIAGGGGGGAGNANAEGGAGGGQGTASDSSLLGQDGQGGGNPGEGGQSTRGGRHGNGTSPRTTAAALVGQTNIYGGSGYTSGGGGGGGYYGGGGGGHTGSGSGMGGAGGGSGYVSSEWTRIASTLSLPAGGAHATTGADGTNGKVVIIVDGSTAVSVTSTGTTATYEVV